MVQRISLSNTGKNCLMCYSIVLLTSCSGFFFIEAFLMETYDKNIKPIFDVLNSFSSQLGFEFHPFLIGWYNNVVDDKFRLEYFDDTLAICIVTTPSFFEKCFLPYIQDVDYELLRDPIDQCISAKFDEIKKSLPGYVVDIIHDFELHQNVRRAKILVQTAGHISGAAYYCTKSDVENQPWGNKKIFGVSVHKKYGGWFAFRGALIFKELRVPSLKKRVVADILSNEDKIILLNKFNNQWQDWSFRDVISVEEKYSELQRKYFITKPAERFELIKDIQQKHFKAQPELK